MVTSVSVSSHVKYSVFPWPNQKKWLAVISSDKVKDPLTELHDPRDDDDEEREELGICEDVLYGSGPADLPAVDEAKDADAHGSQQPDWAVGGVALREERLGRVHGEGEGHDGDRGRTDDDTLGPQPDKRQHLAKRHLE